MRLSQDHKELWSALNAYDVQYVVVGGYAVGVHAEPRATKYLDVFIRADEANSQAVFRALAAFGAPLAGFSPDDFNDGRSVFHMGQPPAGRPRDLLDVAELVEAREAVTGESQSWDRLRDV